MNALALRLDYEGRQVRMVGTDEAPMWVAADVCDVLGLNNPTMALRGLAPDETGLSIVEGSQGEREVTTLTEPGLYALISRSRKPAAKAFDRWVRHDVLPAIRKHGCYPAPALARVGADTAIVRRDDSLHEKVDTALERLSSLEQRVEDGFGRVVTEVREMARSLPVQRRDFLVPTERRFYRCAADHGGRCPCCGKVPVVNDDGEKLESARIDHWFSRDDNRAESGWVVCARCNDALGRGGRSARNEHKLAFDLFQSRLKSVPEQKRAPARDERQIMLL